MEFSGQKLRVKDVFGLLAWDVDRPQAVPCVVPNKLQPHGGGFTVADLSNALRYT